ncbi:recombinase family protein [Mameliella alba]|nr:recombinase family protein [Antarctobacter heliothermus]MBY6144969.1 recombinase family protein [Mameliella alba]MCA0955953.1 recombinase family protein [Mameliella alba]
MIYARYSSARQKETSIEDQVAMGRDYCARQGWEVVDVFTDSERTGRNLKRPGFQAMTAAATKQAFDVVVVEVIDRLTRKVRDALGIHELFAYQNIQLFSIQEGGEQNFMNVLFLGFSAQQFSDKISDHTKRGIKGALRRGVLLSRAYGYRKAPEGSEVNRVIDEFEANVVKRIYEMTAAGHSSFTIAKALNADLIPAPTGGSWDSSTIRGNPKRGEGILYNPLYIGRPQVCRNTGKYHPETAMRRTVPSPEEMVEAHHPSLQIISDDLWQQTREAIAVYRAKIKTNRNPRDARRNLYLLSGLMFCGCCGHKFVKTNATSYSCREASKGACSNKRAISRKRLEKRVFGRLRSAFRSPEMMDAFAAVVAAEKAKQDGGDMKSQIRVLEEKLKALTRGKKNIQAAIMEGAPYAEFRAQFDELVDQESAVQARLASLKEQMSRNLDDMPPVDVMFEQAITSMETILGNPDDVEQAHQYLKTLIRRIVLTSDENALHGMQVRVETDFANLFLGGQAEASDMDQTHLYCRSTSLPL